MPDRYAGRQEDFRRLYQGEFAVEPQLPPPPLYNGVRPAIDYLERNAKLEAIEAKLDRVLMLLEGRTPGGLFVARTIDEAVITGRGKELAK